MKRRSFLKSSMMATGGLFFAPALLQSACSKALPVTSEKLVVIQLSGGNDGLNTVIPYRNDIYYKVRPNLAIPKQEVLKVGDELGLHPSLNPLRRLYDDGYMSVINAVGYPNPIRSHFRSMDIWQSGSSSQQHWDTGWLGRYLDAQCDNCETSHIAIEINDLLGLALKGENYKGLAMRNPKRLYRAVQDPYLEQITEAQKHAHEHQNLGYLYKTLIETQSSAQYIYEKSKIQRTTQTYPQNSLAQQLKTVAQMMISGLDTQIYYVSLSGFDTHANQPNTQARLLKNYAESVDAFIQDLQRHDLFDRTLIMTFSEFGRRLGENASRGTDHGTANNVFLMGGNLKQKGFYNQGANLSNLDGNEDLKFKIDFRRIYATILRNWLQADDQTIMGEKFDLLKFV